MLNECRFSFSLTVLLSGLLAAQEVGPFATLEIAFPAPAAGIWGRYVAGNGRTVRSGWLNQQDGYAITRLPVGRLSHVRGIVYLPGCALQTFDIAILEARSYQHSLACEPASQVAIQGAIPKLGRLYDDDVTIEAKYVAAWAPDFFAYDDGTTTEIPLGGVATLDDQNHFRLPVPDLSKDKLAGSSDHAGEVRIFIRSQRSGRIIDSWRFISKDPKRRPSRLGGIPVELIRSDSSLFTFCPAGPVLAHDSFGFALRPVEESACAAR